MAGRAKAWEEGQMSVELAVLVPVIIVVALTGFNLLTYVELCAAFDHIALDAVISQGVAPAGALSEAVACGSVQSCIEEALGSSRCSVRVRASSVSQGTSHGGVTFPLSPLLTEYTCTLAFRPWPSSFVIAGVAYESPLVLTHERTLVVDRFRPGVVV